MSHIEKASTAFRLGDHRLALNEINLHLGASGGLDSEAAWLAADCMAALRQHDQAQEFYALALEEPGFSTVPRYLHAARHALDSGRHDAAMLFGLKAKRLLPEDPEVNIFLLQLSKASGNLELLDYIVPPLLKAAVPDYLNQLIVLLGPDRSNPLSLDLFKRLAELYPERSEYLVTAFVLAREFCDHDYIEHVLRLCPLPVWASRADLIGAETPLDNLYWCGDERLNPLARAFPGGPPPAFDAARRRAMSMKPAGARLHVGYLSSDFLPEHATMVLLADVLRRHDREGFEFTLFCHTAPSHRGSAPRPSDWGRIVDLNGMDDAAAAAAIRAEGVDILVDLKGHTAHTRSTILNHGAAPLQVAWLGFPGSVTGIDLDYVISDRFVTPDSAAPHFSEAFCRLPHTYQPNDPTRPDPLSLTRAELGLPDRAFVMACFNTPRKISLEVIDCWAEILAAAPNSVLWLLHTGPRQMHNLRLRLHRRGVDPQRIIFSPAEPQDRHLARLKAADIALDTFPYNGHTTTSDALWAGLPVVTAKGTNFASRVSESLLNAVGMPELVAEDREAYVALACSLASDPGRTQALRQKLEANRRTTPLYDSEGFARDLERAYRAMHERALRGEPPATLEIPSSAS